MAVDIENKKWSLVTTEVKLISLVHHRQVDGLLQFAGKMRWPYVNELREVAEEAYSELQADKATNAFVWDWLFGLILPGRIFSCILMATLIQCSPTVIAALGEVCDFQVDTNLVLEKQSYWRVRSVLGRVLGPLRGVKSICGWLGPCPPVKVTPPGEGSTTPLLVRLSARHVPPRKPLDLHDETIYIGGPDRYKYTRPTSEEDLSAYFADMMSEHAWITPQPPVRSLSKVTLDTVALKKLPAAHESGRNKAEYRASLVFSLDSASAPVTYTLYTNPIFITLPPCYSGPHAIHRRERERFQAEPWEVERLKEHVAHEDEDDEGSGACMVINATGSGAEVLARAWCSERGKHAVVVRDQSPCLVCAIRGAESLEVGVVIWVG